MLRHDLASRPERWAVAVVVGALTLSFFQSTLGDLLDAYRSQPSYSHGLLVIPAALCLVGLRGRWPPGQPPQCWPAAIILLCSLGIYATGAYFYIHFLCSCALWLWLLGLLLLWGGTSLARHALPAWGFLVFAIPLPFTVEAGVLLPLQAIATRLSCAMLVISGHPAYAEGTQIQMLRQPVTVAAVCSGLSLMLSTVALSYFYCFAVERSLVQRLVLLGGAVPIAIVVNALRIATSCCLYSDGVQQHGALYHDLIGWLSVPLAVVPLAGLSHAMCRLTYEPCGTAPAQA